MKLDNVFKKTRIAVGRKNYITFTRRPEVPEGLLRKCNKCGGAIIAEDVKKDHYICPKCGGYFRVHARRRIEMITDEGSFEEWDSDLQGGNPLEYKGYEVNYVSNFTDVDDKIIKKAIEEGVSPEEVSGRYIEECKKDMAGMNVKPATTHPQATQEIDGMISMIQTLMDKGLSLIHI